MFALDNDSAWKVPDSTLTEGRETDVTGPDKSTLERHAPVSGVGLHDNWDDPDGYYRVILGEKLDQRYQVYSILGRGIFATVVRAKDLKQNGRNVAIKIARRQETMFKAGMKEIGILKLLAEADPEDKMFVVRLENHFEHRGHLFLLRKENIIHADIKPDNILVNEAKTVAKLADLGSASRTTEMEITPYLHFEDNNTFISREVDTSTGEELAKRVNTTQPTEDLRAKLLPGDTSKRIRPDELRQTQQLIDLLQRMLELDPAKRITPLDALQHAFVQ
ncbi:unnamed protein product [Malassezia sympodialis ATCC 42132]|uniref:uncharacterized protein n=1 Tax=Malassezia sympodialis (strain ATCC 42132) TaxID=1230383 RepID=UPI0002C2083A|nr:uncharacterized protein MSY001_2797 [Malassezia sympodialis ATCC 42132]CCV00092.1 unnamed protein product [Malassezia sympodialis ATCC 42132]|eukprot:XP_018741301.1 uncharacterized protein MSY001_2797 [Malassezia sympodialis ATCC 42132]